jgi:PAS domain S-box-containing protein
MTTSLPPSPDASHEALKKSEIHLTGILESTADAILAVDADGRVIRANRRFATLWSLPQSLLQSGDDQALLDFVLDQLVDPQAFLDRVRALYASTAEDMDTLQFKDGRIVERYSSPLLLDGELIGRVWSFRDVTRQKHAEALIQDSEARMRAMLEAVLVPMGLVTSDQRIGYVNDALLKSFGWSRDELLTLEGWQLRAFPDPAYREQINDWRGERLASIASGGKELPPIEADITCKDGRVKTCLISWNSAQSIEPGAVMTSFFDITDRKAAELQSAEHAARIEGTFMQTVGLISTLGEMRDAYTAGHERRVAELSHAIGTEMGLEDRQLEGIKVGGFLHDVGNMNIPGEILSKPGSLSPVEMRMVRLHTTAGYEILKNVDFPWPVAQVALQHHERMDGSGYPQGLKGEEILLDARVVAVADVVEAMASHRPYRPALGMEAALAEIEKGRGTLYDAGVVDACLRLVREKGYVISGPQFHGGKP